MVFLRIPFLLLLLLVAFSSEGMAAKKHPLLGKKAPSLMGRAAFKPGLLKLAKMTSEVVPLKDKKGNLIKKNRRIQFKTKRHPVVLNFFATYCVPCIKEIPVFNKIAKAWGPKGVKFLYVNVDTEKSAAEVKKFALAKGIAVEMMMPSVRYVMKAYGIDTLPKLMIISGKGKVVKVIGGFKEDLTRRIGKILKKLPKDI